MSNLRLQHYSINRLICRKSGYKLYEAHDAKEERRVFMKILDEDLAADSRIVRRFFDAATLSSYINSPNILRVYDCGKTPEGYVAIISEPVEGKPLSFFIQNEFPMEYDRAIELTKEIANVLRQAHLKGVVHGNLNPGCIFVSEEGGVKIDDFGMFWLLRYLKNEMPLETHCFSTEVQSFQPVDGRSDIYSLGIILFTLLFGEMDFYQVTNGQAAIAKALPHVGLLLPAVAVSHLEKILLQCLHPNAELRFSNMQDFSRALDRLQAHLSASSPE